MAFWRSQQEVDDGYESPMTGALLESPDDDGTVRTRVRTPKLMVVATSAMVALTVALSIFAGPLFQLGDRAATGILDPYGQIDAVMGEEAPDVSP